MKKVLALLLIVAMAAVCVSCSGGSGMDEAKPTEGSQTASGTLKPAEALPEGVKSLDKFTITYFDFAGTKDSDALRTRFYKEVEKLWYAMYPNSTLEITGTLTDGLELLQTQLASGTAADVFKHQTRLAAFAQGGYLMDLSDQPWADKIVKGCLPDCMYNGKIYAAPVSANGWGVYYVKQLFEDKLGLKPPSTFQEFLDICEKIKQAGYDPIITGGADGWPFQGLFLSFTSFLYGANENFHVDLYNGKASLAGKEMNELFRAIQTIYDKGYFSDACMSIDIATARQYMGEGKAVMGFGCPGVLTPLEEEGSGYDIDLGYFYIPDTKGYNCLPVISEVVFSVNSKYEFGSTYGIDLINCLIDESSLHAAYDNVSPVGFEGISMNYNTLGGKMYQEAFDKGPVVLQCTSWLPPSIFDLYQQTVSSILSGNGFTQDMLQDMEDTYRADKGNVNILQ